jgi:hypothetical protein
MRKRVNKELVNIGAIVVGSSHLAAQAIDRVQVGLNTGAIKIQIPVATTGPARLATARVRRTATALAQNQPDTIQILKEATDKNAHYPYKLAVNSRLPF